MKKFWSVWSKTGSTPPIRRHSTKEGAVKEACDLALKEGSEFYIIESIGFVSPPSSQPEYKEFFAMGSYKVKGEEDGR